MVITTLLDVETGYPIELPGPRRSPERLRPAGLPPPTSTSRASTTVPAPPAPSLGPQIVKLADAEKEDAPTVSPETVTSMLPAVVSPTVPVVDLLLLPPSPATKAKVSVKLEPLETMQRVDLVQIKPETSPSQQLAGTTATPTVLTFATLEHVHMQAGVDTVQRINCPSISTGKFVKTMFPALSCSLCSELFVNAAMLVCTHHFW